MLTCMTIRAILKKTGTQNLMRLCLAITLLTMLIHPAWADTTNRAKQFSPVPGIFVGGVGLECRSKPTTIVEFLLITKDRRKIGVAIFDNDDVTYTFLPITKTTPRTYIAGQDDMEFVLDRQSLKLTLDRDYNCAAMGISDLHKAAQNYLRALLRENKI